MKLAVVGDEHRLARRDVPDEFEAKNIERHALGRDHVFHTVGVFAASIHQGTNAERVAKADDANTNDHRYRSISTAASRVHTFHRFEDVVWLRFVRANHLQLVGKHVEQHLRITRRVDVAQILSEQIRLQAVRVG